MNNNIEEQTPIQSVLQRVGMHLPERMCALTMGLV